MGKKMMKEKILAVCYLIGSGLLTVVVAEMSAAYYGDHTPSWIAWPVYFGCLYVMLLAAQNFFKAFPKKRK